MLLLPSLDDDAVRVAFLRWCEPWPEDLPLPPSGLLAGLALEPGNGSGNGGGVGWLAVGIFACVGMEVPLGADLGLGVGETRARGSTVILGLALPLVGIGVALCCCRFVGCFLGGVAGAPWSVDFGSALGCSGLDVVCCGCS